MYMLRSKSSQLWRPLWAAAIMALVILAATPFVSMYDSQARTVLPGLSVVVIFVGVVRVLNWWFTAGRTSVSVNDNVVVLRSRFRTVRLRSKDVESAAILPGEWRPEWSRWAVHPKIVLELRDGRRVSRQVLLDSNGVLREAPRLQAAIAQAAR